MKKEQFLKNLKESLTGLPVAEIKDILSDYEEHFQAGVESGRDEEDLAKSLGDPHSIGRQLKADFHIKKAENKVSASGILRAVFATASLGFFNLMFVVGPFFGLLFVLCGIIAAGIGIFATGVVGFFASAFATISPSSVDRLIYLGVTPIAGIFLSIAAVGFGILSLIGCYYLARWFYQATVIYLKFNISLINGKEERVK